MDERAGDGTEAEASGAEPAEGGRTIDLRALPAPVLRETISVLSPKGPVLLASLDRVAMRERVALLLAPVGTFAMIALAARGLGEACDPRQEPTWALVYALPAVAIAIAIVRVAQSALRARRTPVPPGVYVLERDVVVAHGPEARVIPIAAVAGVGAPRRLPLGGQAEITLWVEGEPAETCALPAVGAEGVVERIEQAREAAVASASATGEGAARARRRMDPLAALKSSAAWDRASAARPRGDWGMTIAAAIPLALAVGGGALAVRNLASDTIAIEGAIAARDVEALACYVEADGAQAARVASDVLPRTAYQRALEAGDAEALGAYVQAYPEGPDTPAARERWIAMEYERAQESAWSLRAFVSRFPDAPQAGEARAALPRLALAEAVRSGEADAYTYVIREYAGTPEAEEASRRRHARYESALASLLARGGRDEAAAFFRALFAYLEAHDGPEVLVRFRTPSNAQLHRFDALVDETQNEVVEPIAPSFSRRLSMQREGLVLDRFNTALEPLVPRDVLRLARGTNLPDAPSEEEIERLVAELPEEERAAERARILERAEDDSAEPEIRIDYTVVPSGDVYVTSTPVLPRIGDPWRPGAGEPEVDRRMFAAFRVLFAIEMRVPGVAERHRFALEVQPDEHVRVDGGEDRPTDATVYEVLATSAFDRLGEELSAAFLGRGAEEAAAEEGADR